MNAIRQYEFGPAENLRYEEVRTPLPAEGQVRIAVQAAGVHLLDTSIRRGVEGGPMPLPALPMTPGREVAGLVDATGPDVDEAWLGQRVVAHLGPASGGYAERAVTAVDALLAIPDGLRAEEAVAMVGTGRTAMGALEVAQPTADDVMLVTSAAGGLGSLLVQAGRKAGATVVGLAGGAHKVERVRALGADVAVDYTRRDWPTAVADALGDRRPTLALDGVGGEIGRGLLSLLGPGGRLVLVGWSSGAPTEITTADLYAGGLTVSAAIGPRMTSRPGGVKGLAQLALAAAARGELRPPTHLFELADAPAAHVALEARATMGKVVLVP